MNFNIYRNVETSDPRRVFRYVSSEFREITQAYINEGKVKSWDLLGNPPSRFTSGDMTRICTLFDLYCQVSR